MNNKQELHQVGNSLILHDSRVDSVTRGTVMRQAGVADGLSWCCRLLAVGRLFAGFRAGIMRGDSVIPQGKFMFHIVDPLLSDAELSRLRELSTRIRFEDGRQSNPDYTKKNNLQPSPQDAGYQEAAKIVQTGLARNEFFRDYCLPKFVAPPMLTKYEPGMAYGEHVDAAILNYNPPIRIDISCTVFISDPGDYEGGELNIRMGDRNIRVKGKPGTAVLYPSTTFHQVLPVTRGERLVSITFIESHVRDAQQREILVELTEFLHENASRLGEDAQMRLEYVRTNLTRMWHGK